MFRHGQTVSIPGSSLTGFLFVSTARGDLDPEEYQETRTDTLEQMREFQLSLAKLAAGDLSLTDYFASIQLVISLSLPSANEPGE